MPSQEKPQLFFGLDMDLSHEWFGLQEDMGCVETATVKPKG